MNQPATTSSPGEPASASYPLRPYLLVFFGLMGLTALTTTVAYVDLGFLNTTVALAIAGVKALLVVLIFMHVPHSGKIVWALASAGLLFLIILFLLTMNDYVTRAMVMGWE